MSKQRQCAVKRGFFVLRDCGQAAVIECPSCQRPICRGHLHRVTAGQSDCVECAAKKEQETNGNGETGQDRWFDRGSAYSYRHNYYRTSRFAPIYSASYYDSYYDDYDVRAFDTAAAEPLELEAEDSEGFFDS